LYGDLSVKENLDFYGDVFDIPTKERERRSQELLRFANLEEFADRPAAALSGGMQKKLGLACALVHRPSVIFLDEPTVGVDPALRVQFWDHFHRLAADGATLVVSSHVMDEADRCDELLFIRDGRVLARGTTAELRQRAGTDNLETAFLKFAGEPAGDAAPAANAGSSSKGAAR
jgi:ABC-2 type transport system ATP-binding protein